MKKFIVSFLVLISFLGSEYSYSQNNIQTESQLAFNYFRDKEYRPASSLFFNLHKITRSRTYFNYYIDCLIQLEDYQEAEKSIKKEIKKNPDDRSFLIDLGFVYQMAGESDQSLAQYNQVLKKMVPVRSEITSIANAFVRKREYEFAVKTYHIGRKIMNQEHLFHMELATIFLSQRDFEKMVAEYLLALSVDPTQIKTVENHLQSALLQDINSSLDPILKNQLLQKIQTETENISFKELLQWYFMQKKQFQAAFTQARSIDLIGKEDGSRLLSLASTARTNDDFKTALECYQHVVDKGSSSPNYLNARVGDLETRYLLLQKQNSTSKSDWIELSGRYKKFFSEENTALQNSSVLIQYAHINSFFLNQSAESIELLEKALASSGLSQQNRSELKLELADIKLFTNEKWDAILLYSQIEKSNKNNTIGFEAKFKKAKVSYFMGELKWAKAQLDALKGSTSKLIANDAIFLSQLISDNTTLDTSYTAMKIYAEAEFLMYQRKDSLALLKLDELLKNHPGHSLTDEVYFLKYEIFIKANKTEKALLALSKIIEEHPYETLAPKALFTQGELLQKLNETEKAMENYKNIVTEYSDSIYSVEARKKLNDLRK
ncbi:tetratricopeptide repeat protein [Labilibaculum sp. A4]|uniref:tetratricopeptide repeat protein n=1 Tax=Labilibaculum euxinus TaxID=2686357 RepID=UPI000F61C26F|nr:tetratricopeptide repeat protein [Labilibaculum euxinus]MDQ1769926.1 tetratricopeptide repeat protein [Labilibaculum euxinus]MWN76481.1 tetratricopeptide repeat protein [Labilibaculum euxinus]